VTTTLSHGTGAPRHASLRPLVVAGAIFIVVLAVFSAAVGNDFVNYDDGGYVIANAITRRGLTLENLLVAFTRPVMANYHPITWLSHMLDVELWGLAPAGHHLTSILLHALASGLLFLWLARVTGDSLRATIVTLLFAVHPLRVESVVWVSERKDVVSGVFVLACLLCRARVREDESKGWTVAMQVAGVLALLSKPTTVPLPIGLYLVDAWVDRSAPALLPWLRRNALLVTAALVVAGLTVASQEGARVDAQLAPSLRLQTALMAMARHYVVGHQLWPVGLHAPYHYREAWPWHEVAFGAALVLGLSALGWRWRSSRPGVLFGWAWTVVFLLPVIGIVPVGIAPAADRYTYLPSIGLLVGVVYALPVRRRAAAVVAVVLATAALVGAIAATRRQIGVWSNSVTLFQHAVDAEPDNAHALLSLAHSLPESDQTTALRLTERAIASRPGLAGAHRFRGLLLLRRGDEHSAIESLVDALTLDATDGCSHLLLAAALVRRDPAAAHGEMRLGLASCGEPWAVQELVTAWRAAGRQDDARLVERAAAMSTRGALDDLPR